VVAQHQGRDAVEMSVRSR